MGDPLVILALVAVYLLGFGTGVNWHGLNDDDTPPTR
jgi:hypothetical protein